MKRTRAARGIRTFLFLVSGSVLGAVQPILAADGPEATPATETLETVQVSADKLKVLPTDPNESVFGFGKTIIETPRSLTSISAEMLDRVNITDINDLVALTPGSFTQSFFGVAGSLDIRGTAGENYFRGVRRIENPGNYPQAIAASDRIDVVRGPASPIFGPSKVGGYLNFEPKSARAETGSYMKESKGEIGVTTGSWDQKTLHAEVGGPASTFGAPSGYYVYSEFENSGSYYQNTSTKQAIFQASYNIDFTDHFRTEMGGMYQDFNGNQVAGWNRLTQALIDHGTYITGSPSNLDANGNGLLDLSEAAAAGLGTDANFIFDPKGTSVTDIQNALSNPNLHLLNPGTAHIDGSQVLVAPTDKLTDGVTTLYFDMIYQPSEAMKLVNKSFYEQLNNLNENAYGFSQEAHTWAFEDQLTFTYSTTFGENVKANFQAGPQIRHQDFDTGDDFFGEFFDRRDITQPSSPIDARSLATRGNGVWSDHAKGSYTDSSFAALVDVTFFDRLNLLGGGRYDHIHITSFSRLDSGTTPGLQARDDVTKGSWSASLSYQLPYGIRPYVTLARESTLTTGEGGQVEPFLVAAHTAIAPSRLNEYGVKGSFLDGHLYAAVDYFDQRRVDFNAQDEVSNNSTKSTGYEFETRWVVNPTVTLTGAYTNIKVINVTALGNAGQFAFVGAGDLKGVDPSLMYGGAVGGIILAPTEDSARKAGIPENLYSVNAIFSLDEVVGDQMNGLLKGITGTIGVTHVDSTFSGFSKVIKLPAYTLLNLGLHYENDKWKVGLEGKNLTNERYFRSNFPDLFGESVVLPELPRNWLLQLGHKF